MKSVSVIFVLFKAAIISMKWFLADVVYIGTINTFHFELAMKMINAGKHVLCEKPLTLCEKQSKKLLKHARANNVLCIEGIWSRFFPSYQYLRGRLERKELGTVKEVEAEFGFPIEHVDRVT